MIQDPLALLAFMFGIVAFARALENRVAWVKKISSAVVCTLLGILLSNIRVIPYDSPVQQGIYTYAVPYTIVLVILSSKLSDLKLAGRTLVYCFFIACMGSLIGGVIAGILFAPWVGPETWKLAGQFVAAFSGGGMNFVAVGRALETTPSLFAAAAVVDNMSTVPWMLAQVALAAWLAPYFRTPDFEVPAVAGATPPFDAVTAIEANPPSGAPLIPPVSDEESNPRLRWTTATITITDLAVLAALPLAALYVSRQLLALTGLPEVLWLSTLALGLAQVPVIQRLQGAAVLSYFSMHLFFIVLGASSIVSEVFRAGPVLFVFMTVIILIHAVIVYGAGWLLKFDLHSVTIASQATVGGPGSSLALAMSLNWNRIMTPGVIIGVFGYAVGNYFGFSATLYLLGRCNEGPLTRPLEGRTASDRRRPKARPGHCDRNGRSRRHRLGVRADCGPIRKCRRAGERRRHRAEAAAADVAYAMLFLACGESSFITGTPLIIDGGRTAR